MSGALIFAHLLGNDVLGAFQGRLHILHVALDEALRQLFGVALALQADGEGQRLQALFACDLCAGAAPWLVRQVEILELRGVPASVDALSEFVGELTLRLDSLQDGVFSLLQLLQFSIEIADGRHLHLIEVACGLFAVTTDEGYGATLIQ